MKKPDISTSDPDPDLGGKEDRSSWVRGRNCVYQDGSGATYRVSIKTPKGWQLYGYFNDLESASYVANIAILAEGCEEQYELNQIGPKDRQELKRWRTFEQNRHREQVASRKYNNYQAELEQVRMEERKLRDELAAQVESERARIVAQQQQNEAKEAALIRETPTAILLDLLERDIGGKQHRKLRKEIQRRKR